MLLRYLLLCSMLLPLSWAYAEEPSSQEIFNTSDISYEALRVSKIVFEVHPAEGKVRESVLRTQMQTKVGNLFSQVEFDQDLKRLAEQFYRIEPKFDISQNTLSISLSLWEKPTIRQVLWEGNEHVKATTLEKELEVEPGTVYDKEKFLCAFNNVKTYYIKKGYFSSELSYRVIPVEGTNSCDILISVHEGHAGYVAEIRFSGITKEEEHEILEEIYTKKYFFFLSWITSSGMYNPEMVDYDRVTILNLLQDKGYADAAVEVCVSDLPDSNRVVIDVTVDKGTCYCVGRLAFRGNTLYSDEQVWKMLQLRPGMCYSPEKLRESIKAIKECYGAKGYIDAVVDPSLCLSDEGDCYDIDIEICEGEQYRVGIVKVFGNKSTDAGIVLHETVLVPGEIFDMRRLTATEMRLSNIGYFKNVNVYAVKRSEGDECLEEGIHYRDVHIELEEQETGHLGLFGGYSSSEQLFGGVELTERNFNARGLLSLFSPGSVRLRGGGEFFNMRFNMGDKLTSYLVQWAKPHFLDRPWIVGIDIDRTLNREIASNIDMKSYGLNLHATYCLNDFLRSKWHYRYRFSANSVSGVNPSDVGGKDSFAYQSSISGVVSGIGGGLIYDSTNHPTNPRGGYRSILEGEFAGLGGDFFFGKVGFMNAYYYPLTKRGTLKFRADFISIQPLFGSGNFDLPLSERLYLGGENTVRGFRPFALGPLFTNGDPRGGLSSLLLSEEYQLHLFAKFDAFTFVDGGAISRRPFHVSSFDASYGVGLRLQVMQNVPVALGVGFPIKDKRDQTRHFFFNMGGTF